MKVTLNMLFKMYGKSYLVYFHHAAQCKHPDVNSNHLVAMHTIIQNLSTTSQVGLAASAMLAVTVLIFFLYPSWQQSENSAGKPMTVEVMCKGRGGSRSGDGRWWLGTVQKYKDKALGPVRSDTCCFKMSHHLKKSGHTSLCLLPWDRELRCYSVLWFCSLQLLVQPSTWLLPSPWHVG